MKKSLALVIVFEILILMALLGIVVSNLMLQQAHMTEHKLKRKRALLAAHAGVVHTFEYLRQNPGGDPSGSPAISLGNGIPGYPSGGLDVNIDYYSGGGPLGTDTVEVSVDYDY